MIRLPFSGALSVTARIALLSIALALVSNLALVGFVWRQTSADAIAGIRRDTTEEADALLIVWRQGGITRVRAAIGAARASGDATTVAAIVDGTGKTRFGFAPARLTVPLVPTRFRVAVLGSGPGWTDREAGYALHRLGDDWLLTGRNLDQVAAGQRAVERALALAVFLSLALGVVAGLVLARYVAARLDGMVRVVEAAREGDLSRRVDVTAGGGDAFDRLAARLNAMLERLERLMAELRIVTDSLAHDLRSPLARLRTKTEQAVLIGEPQAREAALGGLLAETDLVMRMLTMVIEISRSGSVTRDRFVIGEPAELVEEIGELYAPVAEEAGLVFTVAIDDEPPAMPLHRELMSQAIANMVDNALKHGGDGGAVTLRVARRGGDAVIQVEDRGPGIAPDDRAEALRRFGRLDSARSTPGAGLGMALIEAVARLHEGRIELDDNAPGLIVRMVLPSQPM